MTYIVLFIFGSIIGSLLNVFIYRMPREEKIGMTRSRCPHCKKTIRWHDNIPFISYILLGGKCRYCGKPISFRYFTVELLTAIMLCVIWWRFADPVLTGVYFIFVSFLIIGSFIDLEFFIIPDEITVGGLIAGLVISCIFPQIFGRNIWWHGLLKSLLGAFAGGCTLYLIAVAAGVLLKKEAMGMGDVKLLAMIGSFTGWQWALFTIFVASLLGSLAGIILIILKKTNIKGKIPFGPYLAMGSVISLFWGRKVIFWYTGLFN